MSAVQQIEKRIFEAEKELTIREKSAEHLRGIPAKQNRTAIERLYDRLNALHIERLEAADAAAA